MSFNLEQDREFKRAMESQKFLTEQKKVYELNNLFNTEVQSLFGNIALVMPLRSDKDATGTYATRSKSELRESIADSVNEICTSATVYAEKVNDNKLVTQVRFRLSDINAAKEGDVNGIVDVIVKALTPLLGVPAFMVYNITAEALTNLTEMGIAFDNSIGAAGVIDTGSSIANQQINATFKAIRANIRTLRLLLPTFNKKNPEFVTGFNKSAAVDYSGIRHSGIEGVISSNNAGEPIEGATITGEGKKKVAESDKNGAYKLIKLQVTDMKITIAAPGYETQVVDVKIIRGRIIALNITLQRQIISLSATA